MNKPIVQISKPCNENWDCMSNADSGKFCDTCKKVVIDFTLMSDEKVKFYFLNTTHQKICGRFKANQVASKTNKQQKFLISLYNSVEIKMKYGSLKIFCLFLLSFILMISGCIGSTNDSVLVGDTVHIATSIDTLNVDSSKKVQLNDSSKIEIKNK